MVEDPAAGRAVAFAGDEAVLARRTLELVDRRLGLV